MASSSRVAEADTTSTSNEKTWGSSVAVDYTLLLAGPLGARFGAARALDDMQLLSEDFIGHFKGK